jgi:hypothetical protein
MGQREFLDKDAYSYLSDCGLWSFKTAAAEADKVLPGFQGKTPVAQMPFASELPLSQGNSSISGQEMTCNQIPDELEKMGKLLNIGRMEYWVEKY